MKTKQFKENKLNKIFTVVLLLLLLSGQLALAQSKCEFVFSKERDAVISFKAREISEKTSEAFLKAAESELNSTTGNRVERKFTSPLLSIDSYLKKLEHSLGNYYQGFKLESRDKKTEGFLNVTHTKYLTKLKLNYKGKKLTTKIRLRKYGLSPEGKEISFEKFTPVKSMNDSEGRPYSWLEFKIEHPQIKKAVLKPRIKFHDTFADLLENKTSDFLKNIEVIRSITKTLNTEMFKEGQSINKDKLVDSMIDALIATVTEGIELKTISENLYERTSYSIYLKNMDTDEKINVQLTVDKDIHQHSVVLGKEVPSYEPEFNLAVLEVKIPVTYAELSPEQQQTVPGLGSILDLINNSTSSQQTGYVMDKGKYSRAVRVLKAVIFDDYD